MSGGAGNDDTTTLNGSDGVDGGPGDDRIMGGFDTDRAPARTLRLPSSRGRARPCAQGTATLTLKVARKAKRRFKRLRKATVTLRVQTTVAGSKTTVTRKLKLKR